MQPKIEIARNNQFPTTITEELELFRKRYAESAKGPATDYIFKQLRTESVRLEEELSLIPGPVQYLDVVEKESGTDHIKLRWERPKVNAESVTKYVVMKRFRDENWEVMSTENKCSALITGLKSATFYDVAVFAASEKYVGMKATVIQAKTAMGRVANVALCASAVVAAPVVLSGVFFQFARADERIRHTRGGVGVASTIGTVLGCLPVVGQIMALGGAAEYTVCRGDSMRNQGFESIPEISVTTTQTAASSNIAVNSTE